MANKGFFLLIIYLFDPKVATHEKSVGQSLKTEKCVLIPIVLIINLCPNNRYYHGPTPIQSQQYATSQDIINSLHSISQEMEVYVPKLTQVG